MKDTIAYLEKGTLPKERSKSEKIDMCLHHLTYLSQLKDEHHAVLEIRSHVAWYLKGIPGGAMIKNKIFQSQSLYDIMQILKEFKEE